MKKQSSDQIHKINLAKHENVIVVPSVLSCAVTVL